MKIDDLDTRSLRNALASLEKQYRAAQQSGQQYDLRRGRPSTAQLDLASELDGCLRGNYEAENGIDSRIYGSEPYGIREMRTLFGEILGVKPKQTLVYGNSSLQLIYFSILFAWLHGSGSGSEPWSRQKHDNSATVQLLCPVPGYDRHFHICESLGIDMLAISMDERGPDMDAVEDAVRDPRTKGMFCVPRFSNPSGLTYSDETVERIAMLGRISAPDFRVFWDNAYALHELSDSAKKLKAIMPLCEEYGTTDSVLQYCSTSKISFSGAGVAAMAGSEENVRHIVQGLGVTSIGSDRVNQLRHARFFSGAGGMRAHMKKHANILVPKFRAVQDMLRAGLEGTATRSAYGNWTDPDGGYFVLFQALPGCAREIVKVAKAVKLHLTPAGATHPQGRDPEDSMIRIAPTALHLDQLKEAMTRFTLCVKLVSVRQKLAERLNPSRNRRAKI